MEEKRIPRALVVTTVVDPCILVYGFLFIWTSKIGCMHVQKDSGSAPQGKTNQNQTSNDYPREF